MYKRLMLIAVCLVGFLTVPGCADSRAVQYAKTVDAEGQELRTDASMVFTQAVDPTGHKVTIMIYNQSVICVADTTNGNEYSNKYHWSCVR